MRNRVYSLAGICREIRKPQDPVTSKRWQRCWTKSERKKRFGQRWWPKEFIWMVTSYSHTCSRLCFWNISYCCRWIQERVIVIVIAIVRVHQKNQKSKRKKRLSLKMKIRNLVRKKQVTWINSIHVKLLGEFIVTQLTNAYEEISFVNKLAHH